MSKFDNPLNNIKIASPCPTDWDTMTGDERRRYCGECKLNVYNLSGMTRREAENLLMNAEGRLCVRFYRRADGTVLTKDCPVGWRALKKRASKAAVAVFSMLGGIFGGIFAFGSLRNETTTPETKIEIKTPAYGDELYVPTSAFEMNNSEQAYKKEKEKIEKEELLTESVGMWVVPAEESALKKKKRK